MTLGQMLREAMRRKAAELRTPYTTVDLERDSGVDCTYATKIMRQELRPSRRIIHAWAEALKPYLHEDAAIIVTGVLPEWVETRVRERGPEWVVECLRREAKAS